VVTVYVPFVAGRLHPGTWAAVAGSGLPAQFWAIDPADTGAYGRLVRRLWVKGADMVICEHDVVPTRDQLTAIADCGHGWCSYGYDSDLYPDGPYFGLVRFSGQVMRAHPRAAEVALHTGNSKQYEVGWWEVDAMMARDLKIRGVAWFQHRPPVHHAHNGPASEAPVT
jgi:hypothetical protein